MQSPIKLDISLKVCGQVSDQVWDQVVYNQLWFQAQKDLWSRINRERIPAQVTDQIQQSLEALA